MSLTPVCSPVFAKRQQPILGPMPELVFHCPVRKTEVRWAEKDVFNPAAIVHQGKVHLLFRAEDTVGRYAGTSRIGLAISTNGIDFTVEPEPVLYPDRDDMLRYEEEGGCEDPRVVATEDGGYLMIYTAFEGTLARLCLASSRDLRQWQKHGPVLRGRWEKLWSKSACIAARWIDGRLVASRVNGRYWMFWGEGILYVASSTDGVTWALEESRPGEDHLLGEHPQGNVAGMPLPGASAVPHPVALPRHGRFDSSLVEPGPAAVIEADGITLWYNGATTDSQGRIRYCGGQMRLDLCDPRSVIARDLTPYIQPDQPWECSGQVNQVTFTEGLVRLGNRELLYYGCADSRIGVAERQVP